MTMMANLSDTDMCVKCGLCLPHCPTYNKLADENESPRGRIALIQGWAAGALEASPRMLRHLDNCLLCRACERACPAVVPYGRLMDEFRIQVGNKRRSGLYVSALRALVQSRRTIKLTRAALVKYQRLGLQAVVRALRLERLLGAADAEHLLPRLGDAATERPEVYSPRGPRRGRVGLFTGCMGELVDGATVDAAIGVLTRLGFETVVPSQQTCCGALHLHGGDAETAAALARRNLEAYDADTLDALVTIASGCGATLREYPLRVQEAAGFSHKIIDISQFLADTAWPDEVVPAPLEARVCLHTPCSLRNVMREEKGAERLLAKIPGLDVIKLQEAMRCCGSAGSYMLEHPAMAKALRGDVLDDVLAARPNYLATSNIGCALHLGAGLEEKGAGIEVLHPIVLLARQIGVAG